MADYIPAPDAEFDSWQENGVTYTAANAATPGLAPTTAAVLNIVTAERLRHVVEASKTALEGGGLGWVAWASPPQTGGPSPRERVGTGVRQRAHTHADDARLPDDPVHLVGNAHPTQLPGAAPSTPSPLGTG